MDVPIALSIEIGTTQSFTCITRINGRIVPFAEFDDATFIYRLESYRVSHGHIQRGGRVSLRIHKYIIIGKS